MCRREEVRQADTRSPLYHRELDLLLTASMTQYQIIEVESSRRSGPRGT